VERALPGYRVGEELGSGAFGLVLAGEHRLLGRPVAIKVMNAEGAEGVQLDFVTEARVLAGLGHPHVVQAYDYIEAEGLCVVVMELLPGGTLTGRRRTMSPQQGCAVGLAVAAALHHAHSRGVLHRDIKSDNIMFAADDTVKVTDFGIAKLFVGSAASASGRAGTPMYMAPEQIQRDQVGPPTDLYALGVVLYRLLTGVPPFDPRQPLWHQHMTIPPRPMTGVPGPLVEVTLRALAKSPAHRWADAGAFSLDLAHAATEAYGRGWLPETGFPLHLDEAVRAAANPSSPPSGGDVDSVTLTAASGSVAASKTDGERDWATTRRGGGGWRGLLLRRAVPVLVAVAVAVALTALALVRWHSDGTTTTDTTLVSQRLAAEALTTAADRPDLARRLVVAAYRSAPTAPWVRTGVLTLLAAGDQPLATLSGHTDRVSGAVFSPDGKLLVTRSDDHTVRLWDTATFGRGLPPLAILTGHNDAVTGVVFSPDGKLLATSSWDRTARLWDTAARGENIRPLAILTGHNDAVTGVDFSPDGKLLATSSWDHTARLWDATTHGGNTRPLAILTGHDDQVWGVRFSPDGKLLVTSSKDHTARLWDTAIRGENTRSLATLGYTNAVSNVVFSPDGKLLAISGWDRTVRLWYTTARGEDTRPLATLTGHTDWVTGTVFSPDGKLLATSSWDRTVRLWDTAARGGDIRPLATLTGHTDRALGVVFSPDGKLLATRSDDHTARLWDATARGENIRPLATLTGHTDAVSYVAFSPDGKLLATSSWDHSARIWDLDPGRLVAAACARKTDQLTEAEWKAVVSDAPYTPPCS
jgi:WD40 repeat protein